MDISTCFGYCGCNKTKKGAKYAKRIGSKAKTVAKHVAPKVRKIGKNAVKKSAHALKKRVKITGEKLSAFSIKALNKAKTNAKKVISKRKGRRIRNGGKIGERALKKAYGGVSQKYFSTSLGKRFIDQFANGIAHESKVGYTSLTKKYKDTNIKRC